VNADRDARGIEWWIASVVVLSIGLDPSIAIWRASALGIPSEFRTVSVSASDVALLFLALYGWWLPSVDLSTQAT